MSRKVIITLSVIMCVVVLATIGISIYFGLTIGKDNGNDGYYLFCYFTGNKPEEERVRFALSSNGYDFTPLNNNEAIIQQTLGTLSMRDPFIFRANGKYYIIATDMKSELGWNSNYAMVMWESTDLITWTNERIIDMHLHEGFEHACRVWAPQVIYDDAASKYMVYWSNCLDTDWKTYLVYAYLNDDFTDIGEVKTLYQPSSSKDAIDGDIIYENGIYYLYYKDEKEGKICYVYSNTLTGPYIEPDNMNITKSLKDVEGSCMYKLSGTNTYLMIMDEFHNHKYFMQATTSNSMTSFKAVRGYEYNLDFSPRHGSMLQITKDEYDALSTAKW